MKGAIKTLFETTSDIKSLNIDTSVLTSVMEELVSEYLGENNYKLAFKAAKLTGKPEKIREVLEAIKRTLYVHRSGCSHRGRD
ncbi:hypothetical protein ACFLY5_00810 [Patescibacteria group bacterium]